MRDELNNYKISNPDGADKTNLGERKITYSNDSPHSVRENAVSGVGENYQPKETFDAPEKRSRTRTSSSRNGSSGSNASVNNSSSDPSLSGSSSGASSAASSASSAASFAASSAAASTAAASASVSGIAAVAGSMAAAVATAVLVVAVFVSTLTINLSLLLADMHSLVFEVVMTGAQEEDFENPIYAILTGEDGTRIEQEVTQNTAQLTFDGLQPGREYLVCIRNDEKVFFEKSFCTTTEPIAKGEISSSMEGTEVFISVTGVELKKGDYYTVIAKDADGNVLFSKDGVDPNAEYRFSLSEPKSVFFTLSISGKPCGVSQIIVDPVAKHVHSFGSLIPEVAPMCSTPGVAAHYYCEECGTYFDVNKNETTEEALAIPATGHDYEFSKFLWINDHAAVYTEFRCQNNTNHWYWGEGEVTITSTTTATCEESGVTTYHAHYIGDEGVFEGDSEEVATPALGHTYGAWIETVPADCEHDGFAAHYQCEACEGYFDADHNAVTEESLVLPATGHDYHFDSFVWDEDHNATAMCICSHDETHVGYLEVEMNSETSATCEAGGVTTYYAFYEDEEGEHEDSIEVETEALGHDYEGVVTAPTYTAGGFTTYTCHRCGDTYTDDYTDALLPPTDVALTFGEMITIDPDGYSQGSATNVPFHSSKAHPYVLSGSMSGANNTLRLNNNGGGKETLYFVFNNVTVTSASWSSLFRITAYSDLDVYITIQGNVVFDSHNQVAFTMQGDGEVRIFITCTGDNTVVSKDRYNGDIPAWFSNNILFYLNQNQLNRQGEVIGETPLEYDYEDPGDVPSEPVPGSPEISLESLGEGERFFISATGYAFGNGEQCLGNETAFVSTAENPYVISNQTIYDCDNIISVYQTDSSIGTTDIYIRLVDVTIGAGDNCSLFLIVGTNTVNIHLIIQGNVTFYGGEDQQVFSSQGGGNATVRIYIDQSQGNFGMEAYYGEKYAQTGTIDIIYV